MCAALALYVLSPNHRANPMHRFFHVVLVPLSYVLQWSCAVLMLALAYDVPGHRLLYLILFIAIAAQAAFHMYLQRRFKRTTKP